MSLTPEQARQADAVEKARRREAERNCRRDFLTNPDHGDVCVCTPQCSRNYDPMPYAGADPVPVSWYEGTGVGALYGLGLTPLEVADLAGWNTHPGCEDAEVYDVVEEVAEVPVTAGCGS